MGSRRNRKESVGKRAVLLTVLCLAFSGCAFRGKDASGQGDAVSAGTGSGREPESAGISAEDGSDILENGSESAALNPVSGDGTDAETGEPSDREEPGVSAGQEEPGSAARADMAPEASTGREEPGVSAGQEEAGLAAKADIKAGASTGWENSGSSVKQEPDDGYEFTVCFAGDINLDENWGTTQFLDTQENGIYDCISEELAQIMQSADIMCLNNEFTYSTGGLPLPGKAYTFRAMPERVEVLHQLGVDAVTLANNHVYDYGKEALLDTFTVLKEAGIPYFGAGAHTGRCHEASVPGGRRQTYSPGRRFTGGKKQNDTPGDGNRTRDPALL